MNARMSLLLPAALVLGFLASPAAADSTVKEYLKGLNTVKLTISISQELVDAGMPGASLRTQTELQLRKAGMTVDAKETGSTLQIEIIGCQGPGTSVYACCVHISVNDTVKVARNGKDIITQVWGPDLYVLYLPNGIAEDLTKTTQARIDLFLNDWLQANPR